MSHEVAKPTRRWSRLRLLLIVAVCLTVLLCAESYRRQRRIEWLAEEIKAVGGEVELPEPLLKQLWQGGWSNLDREVQVDLGGSKLDDNSWTRQPPDIDRNWLLEHDDLAGLQIADLIVNETPLPGANIACIIQKNPIRRFEGSEFKGADDAVRALKNSSTLTHVCLEGSDLTDEGLRSIPLEQLVLLRIEHTKVTPVGLRELRRCRRLKLLGADGTQAADAISELLTIEPKLADLSLWLEGPLVTDAYLVRLHELPLTGLWLVETSVSDGAVAELKKKLPQCTIDVMR